MLQAESMTIEVITSRDNSLLRHTRAVRDGKVEGVIYVEGLRLCEEALISGLKIHAVIFSDELARKEKAAELITKLSAASDRMVCVSEKLLTYVSYSKTAQGILLLATRPETSEARFTVKQVQPSLLVVMHRIANPVNVGAILRTSEAAGAAGVITTVNTSDPFSPKSLRGAMGSAFRLPIWTGPAYEEIVSWCRERNIATVCSDAEADTDYTDLDWTKAIALLLGPESTGFTAEELIYADRSVKITMRGKTESLNVSVAAGIFLFEAARQRAIAP